MTLTSGTFGVALDRPRGVGLLSSEPPLLPSFPLPPQVLVFLEICCLPVSMLLAAVLDSRFPVTMRLTPNIPEKQPFPAGQSHVKVTLKAAFVWEARGCV